MEEDRLDPRLPEISPYLTQLAVAIDKIRHHGSRFLHQGRDGYRLAFPLWHGEVFQIFGDPQHHLPPGRIGCGKVSSDFVEGQQHLCRVPRIEQPWIERPGYVQGGSVTDGALIPTRDRDLAVLLGCKKKIGKGFQAGGRLASIEKNREKSSAFKKGDKFLQVKELRFSFGVAVVFQ